MKILICENELPAQNQLSKLVKKVRLNAEIIACVDTGEEALDIISNEDPDLIFMDVELADGPCFITFQDYDIKYPIVFTTGFHEYALKAFRLNSIDYLLKPIQEKDVVRAFKKFDSMQSTFVRFSETSISTEKQIVGTKDSQSFEQMIVSILEQRESDDKYIQRLSIKQNGTIRLVNTSDIRWIESDGNYINIHTGNKKYFMRSTLGGFLKQLDPNLFFQIHKSIVLNINSVDFVEEVAHGDFQVVLKNGETLKMSRNYKRLLETV